MILEYIPIYCKFYYWTNSFKNTTFHTEVEQYWNFKSFELFALHKLIEHKESGAGDYSEPLSHGLVFMVLEENLHTIKGEGETATQLLTLVSTMMMFARCASAIMA